MSTDVWTTTVLFSTFWVVNNVTYSVFPDIFECIWEYVTKVLSSTASLSVESKIITGSLSYTNPVCTIASISAICFWDEHIALIPAKLESLSSTLWYFI